MIYGDSGTGKDIVAREIHKYSNFNDGPFIAINGPSLKFEYLCISRATISLPVPESP